LKLPQDKTIVKFDLFSGFPPSSVFQTLCRHHEGRETDVPTAAGRVESDAPKTLREILRETKLIDLQLFGGERVTVRYMD
jgi:hypothetical protein